MYKLTVVGNVVYRVATHLENPKKSGNSKAVREKSGKLKSVSLYSPIPLTQVLILESFTVSFCTCHSHSALNVGYWLPTLSLINVKQRLLTIALNSISMNLFLPYWKSRNLVWSGKWPPCVYWRLLMLCRVFCLQTCAEFTWQEFGTRREEEIKATTTRQGNGEEDKEEMMHVRQWPLKSCISVQTGDVV